MKVKELMNSDVKCCATYNSLNTAAQIMWDHDCGCVPVVDKNGCVVGMLTDRDICMAAYVQGVQLSASLVTSAMSREVFCCRPDDDISVAEKTMRERQVHRLPVVDDRNHVVGIISLNDIAREAERERGLKGQRQVTDAEIAQVLGSVCAPRHRIIMERAA